MLPKGTRCVKLYLMKQIRWSTEKNEQLKKERLVSFEEVMSLIMNGEILDIIRHPNLEEYAHQSIFILEIRKYIYLVPFVENDEEIFLKTIIPSRKITKKYKKGE